MTSTSEDHPLSAEAMNKALEDRGLPRIVSITSELTALMRVERHFHRRKIRVAGASRPAYHYWYNADFTNAELKAKRRSTKQSDIDLAAMAAPAASPVVGLQLSIGGQVLTVSLHEARELHQHLSHIFTLAAA